MALPTYDGSAVNFFMIPGYTPLWGAGLGPASPWNTPPSGAWQTGQVDLAKAPEVAVKAPKKATAKKRARK